MSVDTEIAVGQFSRYFERNAKIAARAPGRVNLIGEHTDYNHGFVLPMAIERETMLVCAPREDNVLNAYAANLDAAARIDLAEPRRSEASPWLDYLTGVAALLQESGKPTGGADVFILGDVPLGCGLSSSASLEMAALVMFEALGGFKLDGAEAAQLGQRVENEFLGLSSGIMDQFISRLAQQDHVLFLDCRTLEYDIVPAKLDKAEFVIANTGVQRGLTASKYNERVAECAEAVAGVNAHLGTKATHLRDVDVEQLTACQKSLSELVYRRAKHIITENVRTEAACQALRAQDVVQIGELMNASDASLIEDYEVSCDELAAMTAIARSQGGCYGSRMTGGGFGGCTVSLVDAAQVDTFCESLKRGYESASGLESDIIRSSPASGARCMAL